MTDLHPDPSDDPTAGELALGLLDGDERAAALRRMLAERDFAAEVEWWRGQLAALFDLAPEVAPHDDVLARVEASLDGRTASAPAGRGWLWPSLAGVMSIAAALLLALLLTQPTPVAVQPRPATLLAAAITPTQAGEPVSAVWEPATATLRLSAAMLADAGHVAELWVIGGDGVPHSLGLLHAGGRTTLTIAPENRARLGPTAVLAVSVEPLGGSPTGLPTGPVVAKGTLART